jgi:hypothetical protein
MSRQFLGQKLRQPRVIVEMALGERDVDIPAFADRLAIVEAFQHGEQAGMLLQEPGERIEVSGAVMAGEPGPFRESAGGGSDRKVDVLRTALGDIGQSLSMLAGFFVAKVWFGLPKARR